MPGGKRSASSKARSKSRASTASGKKKGRKSAKSARDRSPLPPQREPTMFDPPAMENLYYIAHNAVAALEIRGFGSTVPGAKKKKGGRKGKKK